MRFEIDEDNRILVQRLERVVRDDRVSHAYILEGDHRIDKRAFTESFVKGILCPKHLGENCGECSICDKVDHGKLRRSVLCGSRWKFHQGRQYS